MAAVKESVQNGGAENQPFVCSFKLLTLFPKTSTINHEVKL
jgi:hypothetical protein